MIVIKSIKSVYTLYFKYTYDKIYVLEDNHTRTLIKIERSPENHGWLIELNKSNSTLDMLHPTYLTNSER